MDVVFLTGAQFDKSTSNDQRFPLKYFINQHANRLIRLK